jgi:hypothetical protein
MAILVCRGGIRGDLPGDIARLTSLLMDFNRVEVGDFPKPEELERAPLLNDYLLGARPLPCLVGCVTGHPKVGPGPVATSDVWMIAEELGWARTLSRLYRLGRPAMGVVQ